MNIDKKIEKFLSSKAFGVVGASANRDKYGNKVLRCYMQNNKKVYPVNPNEMKIEGIDSYHSVNELPSEVESISIITPPQRTEEIVKEAIKHGIKNIWMQPGAENQSAIQYCIENNINVIAGGPCILVQLGFQG